MSYEIHFTTQLLVGQSCHDLASTSVRCFPLEPLDNQQRLDQHWFL